MAKLKLKKSFHMGNMKGSHRDIWFINVRPQLQKLMLNPDPDGHIIGLTMLFIWIDVLYVINKFECKAAMSGSARDDYSTSETIEWFFSSAYKDSNVRKKLTKLANSLKHSGFPRGGIILSDTETLPLSELNVTHSKWGEMQIEASHITNYHHKDGQLVIHPTPFYIFARDKIDQMLIDAEIEN